ncbi:MAG TPA: hemerythrin domain-containing protein [Clostridia bacterium]|nr:hemerythrin domain-containing protein [Clostridia bacterium]
MNALDLLKHDHDKMKELLNQLEQVKEDNPDERESLFALVRRDLTVHEIIEEEILYPAFEEQAKLKEIVLEGYEEHHFADIVVEEIDGVPPEDETWGAKLTVLKENVEHHIEEEEARMFKTARELFSEEELNQLGERLAARKKQVENKSADDLQETRDAA